MSPVDVGGAVASAAQVRVDGRLESIRRLGPEAARQAAAAELQVVFLSQLLAAMRRTVPESGLLPKSAARNVYEGLFDRSVAEAMAAGDPFGLMRALKDPAGPADSAVGSQKIP